MADATKAMAPTRTDLTTYVLEEWLPSMRGRLKPSTWDSYRRNLLLHVIPALGELTLEEIGPRDLNRFYGALLESGRRKGPGGLSATTVRYIHVIVSGAFSDAVDLGLIAHNPATRAKPPRSLGTSAHEMRVWDASQLKEFLEFVGTDRSYPALRLSALTGMRRGEVLGLRWEDLDLDRRRLLVRHTLISVAYEVVESTPKTHRPRMIELDIDTAECLQQHRDQANQGGSGILVFTDEAGHALHPDLFTQRFDRLVAKSGLPRIRLHDLRHTHASLALAAGVPLRVMSERLGHASPEFTMKQYVHVLPGMQAAAAQQIADLVGGN